MQVHVIFSCLNKTIAAKVYICVWRSGIWLLEWAVRVPIKGFPTNIGKESPSAMVFGLVDKAGIQEVMMIDLYSPLTLWVLEMFIKFFPHLFLSLVEIGSSRLEHLDTIMSLLVLKQVWLLPRLYLTTWFLPREPRVMTHTHHRLSIVSCAAQSLLELIEHVLIFSHVCIVFIVIMLRVRLACVIVGVESVSYPFPLR